MPHNEEEFQSFMELIDRRLIGKEIPVPWRQPAAIAEICWEMGESRPVPSGREPAPGCYSGDNLLRRAINWYDERYGDSQKTYFGPGRAVVFLRGDIWEIEFPLITGEVAFYAGSSPDAPAVAYTKNGVKPLSLGELERAYPEVRRVDVLKYVKRLPGNVAGSLHKGELTGVLYVFCKYWWPLQTLAFSRRYRYVDSAMADLDAAVNHIIAHPKQGGLAKWSALMATEKLLKSYISHAGGELEKSHDLRKLVEQTEQLGCFPIASEAIDEIMCSASVRYDDPVSRREAARALGKAIELSGALAEVLQTQFPNVAES